MRFTEIGQQLRAYRLESGRASLIQWRASNGGSFPTRDAPRTATADVSYRVAGR